MDSDQMDVSTEEPVADAGLTSGAPATAGVATLVVKRSGAETEISFTLQPPATIGRFDPAVGPIDVDLGSLPEGAYVSRKHAKITFERQSQSRVSARSTYAKVDNSHSIVSCLIHNRNRHDRTRPLSRRWGR